MSTTNNTYKVIHLNHLKDQNYEVALQLPNSEVILLPVHEELVLKFRLVVGKELDESQIIELNNQLDLGRVYQYALNVLSRKSYSMAQLYEKLVAKSFDEILIQEVLRRLVHNGLINDEQYASSYINHEITMGKKGPQKVKQELLQRGVSLQYIEQHLVRYDEETQLEHAIKLANQMVRANRKYGQRLLKQKITQHLLNKGFSMAIVDRVLTEGLFDEGQMNEDTILKKEMQKVYRRYQKLSDYERKSKVVQALMRKGFSYDECLSTYQEINEQAE